MRKRELFDWEYESMRRQWRKDHASLTDPNDEETAFGEYLAHAHPELVVPGWIRLERLAG
jgi:hypothetical protein